jgi:hypothetical protein
MLSGAPMPPWTIRATVKRVLGAIRAQPLAALLAIALPSTIWAIPSMMLFDAVIPEAERLGPGRSMQAVALGWLSGAWGSVWMAGELSAAMNVVRSERARWRPFIAGLRRAPAMFLAGAVVLLPMDLLDLVPVSPENPLAEVPGLLGLGVVIYLLARTALWPVLLLDNTRPFWGSLVTSWNATRGQALRIIALGVVLSIFALPLFVVDALIWSNFYLTLGALGSLCTLAIAELHRLAESSLVPEPALVRTEPAHLANDGAGPPAGDVRESGAGWSRPARPPRAPGED